MPETIFWTIEEVAAAGQKIYQERISSIVETPENIGKMLTLDVETGEYRIGVNDSNDYLVTPVQKILVILRSILS